MYVYTAKLHGKNDFIEVSKNLARYRSENNFGLSIQCTLLKML